MTYKITKKLKIKARIILKELTCFLLDFKLLPGESNWSLFQTKFSEKESF